MDEPCLWERNLKYFLIKMKRILEIKLLLLLNDELFFMAFILTSFSTPWPYTWMRLDWQIPNTEMRWRHAEWDSGTKTSQSINKQWAGRVLPKVNQLRHPSIPTDSRFRCSVFPAYLHWLILVSSVTDQPADGWIQTADSSTVKRRDQDKVMV